MWEVENEIGRERGGKEKRKERHTVSLSSTLYVQEHTGARFYTRLLSPPSPVSRGSPFRLPKTTSRRPSYGNSPAVADAETYSAYVNPCVFTLEPRQIRSCLLTKFRGILHFPARTNEKSERCGVSPDSPGTIGNQFDLRVDDRRARPSSNFPMFFRAAKHTDNVDLENVSSFENERIIFNRFGKV